MGKKLCTLLRDGYWNGTSNVTGNVIGTAIFIGTEKIDGIGKGSEIGQ
jgi:hypothetical protein